MFLNNAIHKYIKEHNDPIIARKGADLMKAGQVSRVEHNAEDRSIHAVVKDTYLVSLQYQSAFYLNSVHCSCQKEDSCEHKFALMYYLLASRDKDFTENRATFLLQQSPITGNGPSFVSPMDLGRANTYRHLDISKRSDLLQLLQLAKPIHTRISEEHKEERHLYINNRNEYCFEFLPVSNKMEEDVSLAIQAVKSEIVYFIHDDEKWYSKCAHCTHETNRLCSHQYAALQDREVQELILGNERFDYEDLMTSMSKRVQLAKEKFEKLYQIRFISGIPEPFLMVKHYFAPDRLRKTTQELKILIQDEHQVKQIFASKLEDITEEQKGHALLWRFTDESWFPDLMTGKLSRQRDKLISNMEITEVPRYLNKEQQQFWDQLVRKQQWLKEDGYTGVAYRQLEIYRNQLSTLQSFIHYYDLQKFWYGNLSKSSLQQFWFQEELADLKIEVREDDWFYYTQIKLCAGDTIFDFTEEIKWSAAFAIVQDKAYLYKNPQVKEAIKHLTREEILTDKSNAESLKQLLRFLQQFFEADLPQSLKTEIQVLQFPQWELYLKEAGNNILFQPIFYYQGIGKFELPVSKMYHSILEQDILYEISGEESQAFIDFLLQRHEAFKENYQHQLLFYLTVDDFVRGAWFLDFFDACRNQGIGVFGQENLQNFRFNTHSAKVSLQISSGIDWFDVQVDIGFGDQKVALKNWVDAVRKGEKFVILDDGSYGLIPDEWIEKLRRIALVSHEEKGKLVLNKMQFSVIDMLFDEISDDLLQRDIRKKIRQLNSYEFEKTYAVPNIIKAELREYQELGYQWLKTLSELNFGGCLADDMGLGKTLQVICILADQKIQKKGTSLVIVPRSLLFNWAAEIEKFCPDLSFINYHGNERSHLRSELFNYDLVITTYDTATNDIEFFREYEFNYIILDESQAIKNPSSKRYKAMRLLSARNRIVMTGTPIENNTFDLFAQFSFINPGIFGSPQHFKQNFAIAIDKHGDEQVAEVLRKLLHPFLLRRTKEQVATDLPERTENIIYCEMDQVQRDYYDALKIEIRTDIEQNILQAGFQQSRFKIIEGLLRLRQVCNSPVLLDPSLSHQQRRSVKIETLMDIVKDDLGNHNALIFSQFTSMLSLVRKELDDAGIPYAYLDGSTKDRKGAVAYFEEHDEVRLFLISLKAGNTGLNLIKADYVYILDPWWNPAVEAQAIDRTHRIGQTKNIFAYKMICRDTIEEKILQLQSKKKKLASDLVVTDEQVFKNLDKDELISLFD